MCSSCGLRSAELWGDFKQRVFDVADAALAAEWISLKGDKLFISIMQLGGKMVTLQAFPETCEDFVKDSLKGSGFLTIGSLRKSSVVAVAKLRSRIVDIVDASLAKGTAGNTVVHFTPSSSATLLAVMQTFSAGEAARAFAMLESCATDDDFAKFKLDFRKLATPGSTP